MATSVQLLRLYRQLLLWLLPGGFRQEYGQLMEQMFRDRCSEVADDRCAQVQLVAESAIDVMGTAVREHFDLLWQDVRYSLRTLARTPVFTVVAVLALAIGIGANTLMFSIVNSVLLKPLDYPEADRLVAVWQTRPLQNLNRANASFRSFNLWRERQQALMSMAAFTEDVYNLTGKGEPEQLFGVAVSADFFKVLQAKPEVGRTFLSDEDQPGRDTSVVISHRLAERRFGSAQAAVGNSINLSNRTLTVIGVMPPSFQFPADLADVWVPGVDRVNFLSRQLIDQGVGYLRLVARLKPGIARVQAQAQMDAIALALGQEFPEYYKGRGIEVVDLQEQIVGDVRPALLVLFGAVGCVLLIACANVANLLLARAAARRRELAIRTALGATVRRLVRQLLTESMLLFLLGAGAGLAFAFAALRGLIALAGSNIPRLPEAGIDGPVLLFTLVVALATGAAFGLVPAAQASRFDLNTTLKDESRGSTGGRDRNRLRSALVVAEVALALVLLTGAGLLLQSFWNVQRTDPGFETRNSLVVTIGLAQNKYATAAQQVSFYERVEEQVSQLPGVRAIALSTSLPNEGNAQTPITVLGRPPVPNTQRPLIPYRSINPGYFKAMGIPLKAGRLFEKRDRAGSPGVLLVSESFARKFFFGDATTPEQGYSRTLGQRLLLAQQKQPLEIVGIVADVRQDRTQADSTVAIYQPIAQQPSPGMELVVKSSTEDPLTLTRPVSAAIRSIDPDQPVANVRTLQQILDGAAAQPRFSTILLGSFALLALVLAMVGIYGVMSYNVTQRTHEIGVRMALGAGTFDVLRLIVGQGLLLALVGVGIGIVCAVALSRVLTGLLYQVEATDPLTLALVALILVAVAVLASWLPARRAIRVDPMIALRYE